MYKKLDFGTSFVRNRHNYREIESEKKWKYACICFIIVVVSFVLIFL